MLFGNGGSAGDAQHLATELTVRYKADRAPIAAIALTTDTSTLTAAGNDFGFERIFARQIEALGRPDDVALGLSTSGKSPNVLSALAAAREKDMKTVLMTGEPGRAEAARWDVGLVVPSSETAHIQEIHLAALHFICRHVEEELKARG